MTAHPLQATSLRAVLLTAALITHLAIPRHAAAETPESESALAQYFGFEQLELFQLERRSGNMLAGDLNADGLTDLILVDNSHSRLDLLQQRPHRPDSPADLVYESSVNAIPDHWRFEHRKIPVDRQIKSLALGDFNHDGRTDVAYFGGSDRLVVRYQPESGDWTEKQVLRLPDVPSSPWLLAGGDLNDDGTDDLVVLGKDVTYVVYQKDNGELDRPVHLMNTSDKLSFAHIADLDGDGRNDLCYLASDRRDRSLCIRLQGADGRLEPELRFDLEQPRSVTLADIDGRPGQEVLMIHGLTNRINVSQIQRPVAKQGELAGRLVQYGFGQQGSKRDRDLAIGDVDGDGLQDVIVTDPAAAQVVVFRQSRETGLDLGTAFPSLLEATQVRIDDSHEDETAEVFVLSSREKMLGSSRFQEGRLTFPKALPLTAEPLAFELADIDGTGDREIVCITRERDGRSSSYSLQVLQRTQDGRWELLPDSADLKLSGTPERLVHLDANHDGRPDLLVFFGFNRQPQLLTVDAKGQPTEITTQRGIQLGEISPGSLFMGDLDKRAILVAQKNFARSLQLDENEQWQVIDQFNASESNAQVVGVAAINLDGQPGNEVVLVDTGIKKLRVRRREGQLYQPWREVEIGDFPYKSTHVADLNGDGQDDLLLFGTGKFSVLYTGQTDPVLKEIASFETKLEKTYFADIVAGDLNDDGHINLAVIDTRSHYIELLDYDAEAGLRHALHFKVFEEKSFSSSNDAGSEPREAVIADVTADGRSDLILLSHDRVLVYPQDPGILETPTASQSE